MCGCEFLVNMSMLAQAAGQEAVFSESLLRVPPPSPSSESLFRVSPPFLSSESFFLRVSFRVSPSSLSSESFIRVSHPSLFSPMSLILAYADKCGLMTRGA